MPAEILEPLKEMGVFDLACPRGRRLKADTTEDSMGMVIVTEELSRGSLGAAGSLITRPEIARACLGRYRRTTVRWLPQLLPANRAVSVTEPNTGLIASVALKATKTTAAGCLTAAKLGAPMPEPRAHCWCWRAPIQTQSPLTKGCHFRVENPAMRGTTLITNKLRAVV